MQRILVVTWVFAWFPLVRNVDTRMTNFLSDLTFQEEQDVYYDASLDTGSSRRRGPVINIGASLTIDPSSEFAGMGREVHRAFTIWVDWVNNVRGGILVNGTQCSVKLKIINDLSNGNIVKLAYASMLNQGYRLFFGPYSSGLNGHAASVINGTDAVMLSSGASATSVFLGRDNVFGLVKPAELWFESMFANMKQYGVKSVIAIQSTSEFNLALCSRMEEMCNSSNITYIKTLTINISNRPISIAASDFVENVLLDEVNLNSPDVLIGCTTNELCRAVLPLLKHFDINFKAMAFAQCVTSSDFLKDLGQAARFVLGPTPWMPNFDTTSNITCSVTNCWKASDFAQIYEAKYAAVPPYQAATAFATAASLMYGIEKAQSVEPIEVRRALVNMSVSTILGPVSFDPNGMLHTEMMAVEIFAEFDDPLLIAPVGVHEPVYPIPPWSIRDCFDMHNTSMQLLNIGLQGYGDNAVCTKCETGKSTNFTATAWNGKHWGWRCSENDCVQGQTQEFNGTTLVCVTCPSGTRGTSGLLCVPCQVGRYTPIAGRTECDDCEAGRHMHTTGASACVACPPGSESATKAAQECRACESGTFSRDAGSANCELCPVGTISNLSASFNCTECPAGKYSAWGAKHCEDCPVGKHQNYPGHDYCHICTIGSMCTEPGTKRPTNLQNWWQYLTGDPNQLSKSIDQDLLGESHSAFASCLESNICLSGDACSQGHIGVLCGSCLPGYDMGSIGSDCSKCPSPTISYLFAALFAILVCGLSYVVADWAIQGTMQTKNVSSALMKLLLNYVTTMTFMALVLYREYQKRVLGIAQRDPSQLQAAQQETKISTYMTYDIGNVFAGFFSLECLIMPSLPASDLEAINILAANGHLAYTDPANSWPVEKLRAYQRTVEVRRVLLWGLLPVVLTAALFVFGWIALKFHLWRHKEFYKDALRFFDNCKVHGWKPSFRNTSGQNRKAYLQHFDYRLFGIWRVVAFAGKKGGKFRREFLIQGEPLVTVINFVLFPHTIRAFLRPLTCVEPARGEFGLRVQSNPEVLCYDNDRLFWGSLIGLVAYGFGIPLIASFLLWENSDKLDRERYKRTYGFLISGYEVDRRWWECFVLIRKTILASIASLGMSGHTRLYFMTMASLFFFMMHVFYKPFDNRYKELLDRIESRHLIAWVVWSLVLLAMHMLPASTSRETILMFSLSLLGIHVLFFIMIFWYILRHLRNSVAEKIILRHHQQQQRLLMENLATDDADGGEITLKQLPQEMLSSERYWSWLSLRQYIRYMDKQAYLAVNPVNMNMQILGSKGSRCAVPPKLYEDWIDQVGCTPDEIGDVRNPSEHHRMYFLDAIGETLEFFIVNKELNHISVTAFEFIVRSAFAVGSDGGDRNVILSHHLDNAGSAHGGGVFGVFAHITAHTMDGVRTMKNVAARTSAVVAKVGRTSQVPENSKQIYGVEGYTIDGQLDEDADAPVTNPSDVSLQMPEHNTLEAMKLQAQQDKKAKKLAQKKRLGEIVSRMLDFQIYLRGVTLQEMQLNLSSSILGKNKEWLQEWLDVFEAAYEKGQKKIAAREAERYKSANHREVEEGEEVPPKHGHQHVGVQAKASDIEYQHAIGNLDSELHKRHGMHGTVHLRRPMEFGAITEMVTDDVHDSHLESMQDNGDTIYVVAWSRVTRQILLKASKEFRKNPYFYSMNKMRDQHKKNVEYKRIKEHELMQMKEDLFNAQAREKVIVQEREKLANEVKNEILLAKAQHMKLCREALDLKRAIEEAKGIEAAQSLPNIGDSLPANSKDKGDVANIIGGSSMDPLGGNPIAAQNYARGPVGNYSIHVGASPRTEDWLYRMGSAVIGPLPSSRSVQTNQSEASIAMEYSSSSFLPQSVGRNGGGT